MEKIKIKGIKINHRHIQSWSKYHVTHRNFVSWNYSQASKKVSVQCYNLALQTDPFFL